MNKRALIIFLFTIAILKVIGQIDHEFNNAFYKTSNDSEKVSNSYRDKKTKRNIEENNKGTSLFYSNYKRENFNLTNKQVSNNIIRVSSKTNPPIKLWNGTFNGWTFGYKTPPFNSSLYWKILPNGDLLATGGTSYDTQSGMRTNTKYSNYELTLEYKWLTPGKTSKTGNSGVWIHGQEGFTRSNGAYPISIEVQLKKTAAGDLLRKGLEIDAESGYASQGETVFRRTTNTIIEHFSDQWNTLKIQCINNEISVWLNDVFVNKAVRCRTKTGTPVKLGYITLQCEIDQVVFRNVLLQNFK